MFEHPDECINPLVENMAWSSVEGRVIEVTSVRTFLLRTEKGRVVHVSVVNVGDSADPNAISMLRKMIDGKWVSVMVGMSDADNSEVVGDVHDEERRDVSRQLLRAGAAPFVEAPPYKVSSYTECLHRIAEREAKAEGIGIWHHQ